MQNSECKRAKGRKLVEWAKAKGVQLDYHPYGGAPRAFTVNPSAEDLQTMGDLLEWTWGKRQLSMLDPFAGGGSIPFEVWGPDGVGPARRRV